MTNPTVAQLYDVIDATWAPFAKHQVGAFTVREGAGGGSRVSCATGPADENGIDIAAAKMRELGQTPIFMIRDGQSDLDDILGQSGYRVKDPVTLYAAPIDRIATEWTYSTEIYDIWPPVAIQREIWAAGGIDNARINVMERTKGPKTSIMGRIGDIPAGTGFVSISDQIAMVHALEVSPDCRRKGVAIRILRRMAFWAKAHKATHISLVVTNANVAANALYTSLGFDVVGHYHYRSS
ncbi:hypothetical protein BVC71_08560 [Marivivens niveibacter]|uniref:N-acetyltransferase domain-containing protein n=1 Tax=Marivivens niveibacter TaxID=1930667 RepID=A0A251X0M8_9RHOB|nr:GNAT family N-acetyltransferase [Marivivens niveibacter]OUD09864.1 hypothetical protein BVC71_08560 [Marivivens niveibacter]